jgi:beta-lactamase superfamily II metal-dependent hydrolase
MLSWALLALQLEVAFVSVGQGDCTLITSPAGKRVLVDGGPPEGAGALERFLRSRVHTPLDLVLLTHRHLDHLGGLERVLSTFGVRLFLDSEFPHDSPAYRSLERLLDARHVPMHEAGFGRRVDLGGGALLTLLGPPSPPIDRRFGRARSDVNANSVVARLDWRRASVLLAADAEAPTERWLLARGAPLAARVLKVAHHGSRYSTTPPFLRAVKPEIAVISVGARNDYHHPHASTIARLRASGAQLYRTDEDGDVIVRSSDGERLEVERAARAEARP